MASALSARIWFDRRRDGGGAGSTWTNSVDLYVGDAGSGTLTIRNGGAVSNGYGFIGADPGSTGVATVDGPPHPLLPPSPLPPSSPPPLLPPPLPPSPAGSTWTNSADLHVGYGGTGTLNIRNGGSVSAPTTSIAIQAGSIGTLNIGAAVGQAAVAPGTLSTASVNFGSGIGQLVFNHTGTNYTSPLASPAAAPAREWCASRPARRA